MLRRYYIYKIAAYQACDRRRFADIEWCFVLPLPAIAFASFTAQCCFLIFIASVERAAKSFRSLHFHPEANKEKMAFDLRENTKTNAQVSKDP